ncbi:MAG TPA: hypothetical protein VMM76_05445 [Pirellulaceae bacterium]|nr:hypothetical protein [Pirellulaceae bacterium]
MASLGFIFFTMLGCWWGYHLWLGLESGELSDYRSGHRNREDEPIGFYLAAVGHGFLVALYVGIGIVCLAFSWGAP